MIGFIGMWGYIDSQVKVPILDDHDDYVDGDNNNDEDDDHAIILPLFGCDEMVFHFKPILGSKISSRQGDGRNSLIMKNVQMGCIESTANTSGNSPTTGNTKATTISSNGGTNIKDDSNNDTIVDDPTSPATSTIVRSKILYRPCPSDTHCRIVDGEVKMTHHLDLSTTQLPSNKGDDPTTDTWNNFTMLHDNDGIAIVALCLIVAAFLVIISVCTVKKCRRRRSVLTQYQQIDAAPSREECEVEEDYVDEEEM